MLILFRIQNKLQFLSTDNEGSKQVTRSRPGTVQLSSTNLITSIPLMGELFSKKNLFHGQPVVFIVEAAVQFRQC